MASRKKGRKGNQSTPSAGGFVPASQKSGIKRNSTGFNSLDFNAAPAGAPGDSVSQYSRNSVDYTTRRQGMAPGKKRAIAIITILLIIGLGVAGFFVFKEYQKSLINQDLHSLTDTELQAVDNELSGSIHFDAPFTMLLLGSDARSDDPSMGARTDTIVLVRIDPTQNKISMLSIPRDTMIDIPGVGTQKFNAAYAYGGPSGTISAVKELCGVEIDHYAEVNFEGLVGLIDAIGGIDVYVDEEVNDPDAGPVVIPAGEQHLDGTAALTFSRSRAYANGDFTRVSNQRKVIEGIVHKGLEAPATELHGLVQASASFLTTDSAMDVDFIYSLADQIRHNNDYELVIYTATIPATTATIGGASYVIADNAALAELIEIFLAGGDISEPLDASSIDSDRAAAMGNTSAGTIDDSYNYHADEPVYQQEYVNPDPSPSTKPSSSKDKSTSSKKPTSDSGSTSGSNSGTSNAGSGGTSSGTSSAGSASTSGTTSGSSSSKGSSSKS